MEIYQEQGRNQQNNDQRKNRQPRNPDDDRYFNNQRDPDDFRDPDDPFDSDDSLNEFEEKKRQFDRLNLQAGYQIRYKLRNRQNNVQYKNFIYRDNYKIIYWSNGTFHEDSIVRQPLEHQLRNFMNFLLDFQNLRNRYQTEQNFFDSIYTNPPKKRGWGWYLGLGLLGGAAIGAGAGAGIFIYFGAEAIIGVVGVELGLGTFVGGTTLIGSAGGTGIGAIVKKKCR